MGALTHDFIITGMVTIEQFLAQNEVWEDMQVSMLAAEVVHFRQDSGFVQSMTPPL